MMKKTLPGFFAAIMLLCVTGCALFSDRTPQIKPLTGTPLDYSQRSNWMYFHDEPSGTAHPVDLIYFYPTSVPGDCKTLVGEVDDAMKHRAKLSYVRGAECMASYTNVYVPYYRQISVVSIQKARNANGLEKLCRKNVCRTDVYAALDYYFEHENKGRPFIFAGHSQGSFMLKIVLSEYMRVHPEYLERMVACYAIGGYFPKSWFKANPHIKPATGERDTGVLISWNSEAPGGKKKNFCVGKGTFNINPLNWKTDETPAGIEQNFGSMEVDPVTLESRLVKGKVNARINLKRGVLVCEGDAKPMPPGPLFGDKSFHVNEWDLFYWNIKENGQARILAYLEKHNSKSTAAIPAAETAAEQGR